MKDGTLTLATGSDYAIGEESEAVADMIKFAKADKVKISAFAPGEKKGPYSPAQVTKLAETRDAVFMLSFRNGFPSPYLSFFSPDAKVSRPAKKPSKYARS